MDYSALAKQYGAISSIPQDNNPVDYSALASQYGAISAPTQTTPQPTPQPTPAQPDYLQPFAQIATGHPLQGLASAVKLGAQGIMNAPSDIANQAKSGFDYAVQGADLIRPGAGPLAAIEGTRRVLSGMASVATSPLAPFFKPLGGAINNASDAVQNIPAYQQVARTLPNLPYDKYANVFGDISNITGTAAGAGEAPSPSDIATGAKNTVESVQQAATDKAVNSIADTYREVAGQTIKANKTLAKSAARGNDPAQWLAERNIIPAIEDGKMHTTDLQNKITQDAAPMNEHLNIALHEIQPSVPLPSLDNVRARALNAVSNLSNMTETARATLQSHINQEFDLLKARYGDNIDLASLNRVKQANWASTPFDSTKPYQGQANYLIGKAAKDTIEKAVPKDAVPVHDLNAEIGKMYDARKFLASLEGKAVKGGRLGKYFARTIGATIGHGVGGTLGAIGGAFGGDAISNLLQGTTFSNPLKQMIMRNLAVQDPAAYQQALKFIENSQAARATRLALPPAGGTSPAPIELPSPGILQGQQAINGGAASPPPPLPQGPAPHPILGSSPKILQQAPKEAMTASQPSRLSKLVSSVKDTIGDQRGMIRNPLAPAAPKTTPMNFANMLNGKDIPLVQNFVNNPSLDNLIKLQPIIEAAKLNKLDITDLHDFMIEVMQHKGGHLPGGLIEGASKAK